MAAESRLEGAGLTGGDATVGTVDLDTLPPPPAVTAASTAADDARALLADIERTLREQPHSFGFFQAVRLLERLYPDRAHVGGFDDPAREVVRFGVPPTLAFPASEIQELSLRDDEPCVMRVNFMGLTGPQGVLPHVYTLLAQERLRSRDRAVVEFLDLFHHRLISLFYQAWRKYRFTVAAEENGPDGLRDHLLDLIGLGIDSSRNRLPLPDDALAFRAGLLIAQPRSASSLQQLLEDFFEVGAEVEQFVGGWYTLAEPDRCAVGEEDDPANELGAAVVGEEIWDAQARIRVRLGPLRRAQYDTFLPGGRGHRELAALVRFFSHDQFDVELQLVLAADDVPGVRLGDDSLQLGWSSWIRCAPRVRDGDETLLHLDHRAAS
jgi:type VI secretion system protein ImpH